VLAEGLVRVALRLQLLDMAREPIAFDMDDLLLRGGGFKVAGPQVFRASPQTASQAARLAFASSEPGR
jgi:hypothetical protein